MSPAACRHTGADGPATGPLTRAKIVQLQRDAKALWTDLTLHGIASADWVNARALMVIIASQHAISDDDHEIYGESVRFTDFDYLA